MEPIKKPKKVYTLRDVTANNARMLLAAAGLPDKSWYCFGASFYKLDQLDLIDEDLRVTPFGLDVANRIIGALT